MKIKKINACEKRETDLKAVVMTLINGKKIIDSITSELFNINNEFLLEFIRCC